ncbi:M14 family metallocarboxypeptidase [Rubritalea spongiae]|uniref:M14 family metallocarboxypeptidase n=2 Tax=Rubritalea spongiae TaxID=430797 RepID=A0ABW5E3L5_9BACT
MDVHKLIKDYHQALSGAGAEHQLLAEVEGYSVYAYHLLRPDAERLVYLSAGIHGDEPAGPLALLELIEEGILDEPVSWVLCPVINPTGLAANRRENFQGLDLNRDYLKKQSVEIASHANLLDSLDVDFAISLHEDWESSGFYFYEINQADDRPQRYDRMVQVISSVMPMEREAVIDDHAVREAGWIYHENKPDEPELWPEAIYLAMRGCPLSFTFETPSSLAIGKRIEAHKVAVRAALRMPL